MLSPKAIHVWNAHKLELAELYGQDPRLLTYPALEPSLTAPGAPTDIVDVPR